MIAKLFQDHPASVGETYFEHLGSATGFGVTMILAGFACLIHGVFPFLFVKTGSRAVGGLYSRMIANRLRTHRLKGWHDAGAFI